jgi:hypothetical protein
MNFFSIVYVGGRSFLVTKNYLFPDGSLHVRETSALYCYFTNDIRLEPRSACMCILIIRIGAIKALVYLKVVVKTIGLA